MLSFRFSGGGIGFIEQIRLLFSRFIKFSRLVFCANYSFSGVMFWGCCLVNVAEYMCQI